MPGLFVTQADVLALRDEIAELRALVRELQRFKDQGEPRYEGNFLSKEPPAPEQQQLPQQQHRKGWKRKK